MTPVATAPANSPWAFWAPAPNEMIQSALDLAAIRPGERFLDLGCGDGRVLLAAARRGAMVRGIEIDPRLAAKARANLVAAGFSGDVVEEDMFEARADADVVFAYLTPVSVAKLKPVFVTAPAGARVISPSFPVCGWAPDALGGRCRMYRMPAKQQPPPAKPGWGCRALLVELRTGRKNLLPLFLNSPGGDVHVAAEGALARAAKLEQSATWTSSLETVALDLIFEPCGAGSVVVADLRAGTEVLTIAAIFRDGPQEARRFGAHEGEAFRTKLNESIAQVRAAKGAVP